MYFLYVDETGDPGRKNSPTQIFALGGLLVPANRWLDVFDTMRAYRSWLKGEYGILVREELKGKYFYQNSGPWFGKGVPSSERWCAYVELFGRLAQLPYLRVVNVCIFKDRIKSPVIDPRFQAWSFLLQRFETFLEKGNSCGLLAPDDGHGEFIRKLTRKMRRYHKVPSKYNSGQMLDHRLVRVVEDPYEKVSQSSIFTQTADMIAYSVLRRTLPKPPFDASLIAALDPILLKAAHPTDPHGVVVWPE